MALGEENCLDPMRRDFRGIEGDHTEEIVLGDLADIEASDIVLANCWQVSVGTSMEIFRSHDRAKPVVAVVPPGVPVSPWLTYHTAFVERSLEDGLSAVKSLIAGMRLVATR